MKANEEGQIVLCAGSVDHKVSVVETEVICINIFLNCLFSLTGMSRDSKYSKDVPRRRRNDGEPSGYDKVVNTEYQEEVMPIPKGKAGLIIGNKGWRIKDIKEQSGVKELNIRDDQVHIRGTEEQCLNAKKIINRILEVHFKSPFFAVLILYTFLPLTSPNSSPPSSVVVPPSISSSFLPPLAFVPSSLPSYLPPPDSIFSKLNSYFPDIRLGRRQP